MSAAATEAWKRRNPDRVRAHNRNYMRQRRLSSVCANSHIVRAYAEMLGFSKRRIRVIGTLQLCLCRDDAARRILLRAK